VSEVNIGLVLDCADPAALAAFWEQALGMTNLGSAGNYVLLVDEAGRLPKLLLQRVEEVKAGKNRMHLDIDHPDIESEAARLQAIGARRLEPDSRLEHGTRWIIMADPEGNEFCVCDGGAGTATTP
jgi:predicted enzyme related to lactoylglutathione lyase